MFITSTQLALAGTIEYTFHLVDTTSKKELSDIDLTDSHTKKLHFIAYDAALKEFRHVHPTFSDCFKIGRHKS